MLKFELMNVLEVSSMYLRLSKLAMFAAPFVLLAGGALAQTTSFEGEVKGEDWQPLKGALIKIERKRTDIKGNYKVKTDKKAVISMPAFHCTYNVTCEVNGKDVDRVQGVSLPLGRSHADQFRPAGTEEEAASLAGSR
jgi:hypothetical protein